MSPKQPWIETPLFESKTLSRAAGCKIFLKLENLQPSSSFKSRGIGYYMFRRIEERARKEPEAREKAPTTPPAPIHFYASSGGNAGLAAVLAAAALGHPCTVVVPLSTKPFMIAKLRASGARQVIQQGRNWAEADRHMREELMAKDPEAVYVPPFDHPDIAEGHASLVDEVYKQWPAEGKKRPAAVICSVGGGGLLNGVVLGLERCKGWEDVTVLAMETEGANALNASVKAGEHVTLPGITSQATSLGAVRVSEKTWELSKRDNVKSVVLSDAEAAMGAWRLADDERFMVELACGVNVALCYDGRLERALGQTLQSDDGVVVVLCGGSVVTLEMLMKWREEFGDVEKAIPPHQDVSSDLTAPGKDEASGSIQL